MPSHIVKYTPPLRPVLCALAVLTLTVASCESIPGSSADNGAFSETEQAAQNAAAKDGATAPSDDDSPGAVTTATDDTAEADPDTPPGGKSSERRLTPEQLRQRLRAFADQFRSELASACDRIKRQREDPLTRQRAHQYKIDGATAMYDIAVNPSEQEALLDAIVLSTLQTRVVASIASAQFPDDYDLLMERAEILEQSAWSLSAQVMSEKQRAELLQVIDNWWADHDGVTEIWYIRLSTFAGYGKGTSFEGLLGAVGGLPGQFLNAFVPVSDAADTLDQATAAAERATWLAPRLLILSQWRAEAIVLETLAATEVKSVIESTAQAVDVAERLPAQITAEREALFDDLAENEQTLRNLLDDTTEAIDAVRAVSEETRETVAQSEALIDAAERAMQTVDQVVGSVDGVVARVAEMQADAPEPAEPGRPFDITEYTEALNAANAAIAELNSTVAELDRATEPGALAAKLDPTFTAVDAMVDSAAARLERLVIVAAVAVAAAGIAVVGFARLVPPRNRASRSGE
jgi:hypothetical protein